MINLKFHIVRTGETVEDILFLYNLTKDELLEENRHIRVWDRLIPGTKLKIPPITEAIEEEVSEMEPFVEDYYPKLNDEHLDATEDVPFPEAGGSEYEIDQEKVEPIKTIEIKKDEEKKVSADKPTIKTATKPQDKVYKYNLGQYNYPRYLPYTYIVYPVYYPNRRRR